MSPYPVPQQFTQNWTPQVMPPTNLALQNNFNNFNLSSLGGGQQYPPQQPQQYPPQQPQQYPPQQNFGQQGGYNGHETSGMGMNQGMNNNPYGQGYWVELKGATDNLR